MRSIKGLRDLRDLQNMRYSQNLQNLHCLHRIAKFALFAPLALFTLIFPPPVYSQSINISNFYYRDYLDFGQNKGVFKEGTESSTGIEIIGKNGEKLKIPHIPNFYASSNNGSLTNVGRGFVVTANHVVSAEESSSSPEIRKWGLTSYVIGNMDSPTTGQTVQSHSDPYGRDEKFLRFTKYIVEGQVEMLDIDNSTQKSPVDTQKEQNNIEAFNAKIKELADSDGKTYIFQAGSGIIDLRANYTKLTDSTFQRRENGETKGGGFGYIQERSATYYDVVNCEQCQGLYGADYKANTRGINFVYIPNADMEFNNRITTGDSGSGIYAYDKTNQKWVLVGVTSSATPDRNPANISAISNKDLLDFQSKFEQKIPLTITDQAKNTWELSNTQIKYTVRGDTPQQEYTLTQNKDLIFSGGGNIEVTQDITRNISGYAGGFVFESSSDSANKTTYKFTNKNGQTYSFDGSGLDIGENVVVEWALKNKSGESLHKVGKGELTITTNYTPQANGKDGKQENLGYLKIGEGKVTLDTDKKAYDNIYITSGRGELALMSGKAEALGATKSQNLQARSGTQNAESYTLAQNKNSEMGFYFGTGGGKLDLGGNSLTLNTIAANDKNAIVTSASQATLTIEGFGYESGNKTSKKTNTIIHASVGDTNSNIDIVYSGDKTLQSGLPRLAVGKSRNDDSVGDTTPSLRVSEANAAIQKSSEAHLIFDGNINTQGKMSVNNGNVALQGHATAHATISDENLRNQIKTAESGTQKGMPNYMDLSKPSTLKQPDWDKRTFKFGTGGIDLKNSTLTLGRNANLESAITLDKDSKVEFGGDVKHFIDNKDGKNVTGSGFSYQQEVAGGNLTGEALKGVNESIKYSGKITANGGTIQSHIFDFNASLDLKQSAKLEADYLTLNSSSSVKLESSASASVKTLKLSNVSDSDLSSIFKNGSSEKLKVTDKIWFENTKDLTLTQLDSANIDKGNYDIWATKSSVNDAQKEVTANVELFEGSNFVLKSLSLKNLGNGADSAKNNKSAESRQNSTKIDSAKTIKNRVYLGNTASGSDFTKLTLSDKLSAQNLDSAEVELRGKSELKAQSIEFSSVKNGNLILDSESKLTGANGNANVVVKGADSVLNIEMLGDKSFDINASGGSSVVILSEAKNLKENQNRDSSPTAQNDKIEARNDDLDSAPNAKFSGKITAKDSSVVASDLESITASVDLQGSAKLMAKNIELTNGFDSIKLQGSANLMADKITAKNLTQLTLQTNGATANVENFIFDSSNITSFTGDSLIGKNIELKSSTIKTASELSFSSDSSVVFSDKDSKLEVTNLKVTSGNLTLNFNDSTKNGGSITKIDLSGSGSVNINSWDFGNATQFQSNGSGGRVNFGSASYTQNGTPKNISADSTISGALSLSSVGKSQSAQARNAQAPDSTNRFETLKFSGKNLTLGADSTISVEFDSSVKKSSHSGITLGQYYTLISAGGITDNRANKIIDFTFSDSNDALFVVGKIIGNDLKIKFTEADPRTFSELNKHINPRYSDVLKALTEAHPSDFAIEVAANTDDYAVLESRIRGIDSTMNEIAQGNKSRITQNLLFSNEHTINTRISQVRLARASHNKSPLRFAQNGTLYRLQKMRGEAVASDAMPSYAISPVRKGDLLPNNAWLNVGGGYFGGSSQMGFGATNIGYDRLFNADSGDVLVGAMLGFGGARGVSGAMSENARFYNFGLYTHAIFDALGEIYGGHEIQGNVNFSVSENSKRFESDSNTSAWGAQSADSVVFGTLLTLYYKYNFIVASDENISHAVKPVALFSVGYNRNGAFKSAEYRQNAYASANLSYGLGVEYNAVMGASFYSVSAVLKDMAWRGNERAEVSLNGARNFIGYTIDVAPRISAEVSVVGSHKITPEFYIQYGIAGMVDSGANYGIKGDVKVGWKF